MLVAFARRNDVLVPDITELAPGMTGVEVYTTKLTGPRPSKQRTSAGFTLPPGVGMYTSLRTSFDTRTIRVEE